MRLLVIEDDRRLAAQLAGGLRESGYAVDEAATAESAYELAILHTYDAVLLDIGLPGKDGWWLLSRLRDRGLRMPVLCLTARGEVEDKVRGLDFGADDYLVKPFAFEELLARLRAIIRRGSERQDEVIRVSDLEVDLLARRARRGGVPLDLRPKEFALLAVLARRPGHVLSRSTIVDRVWEASYDFDSNIVDVHIRRLRQSVDEPFAVKLIHAVRGAGYVLEDRS